MDETEVPTRAEVAKLMGEVKSKKGSKDEKRVRNTSRRNKVKGALPVEVFEKIDSDLASYPEWEQEVDDAP